MCPNFEKFHQNDSNREQLEIAEGLEEYELKETEKSKNLEKYINLLDQQGLYNYNHDSILVDLLNNVNMSHHKIALKLIHSGYAVLVVENFEKFTNLNKKYHKNIVSLLINNGLYDEVVNNLEKFADITESKLKDIAIKIIKKGGASYLLNDYEFFIEISESEYKDIAIQMIENGDTNNLFQNINIFIGMSESDHKEIVDKMIEKGNGGLVAKNFEKFIGIKESDHTEIVKMVIENGGGNIVAEKLEKFSQLDKEIAFKLIKRGFGNEVVMYFERFTGIKESDHKEIVKMMIENGGGNIVAKNLEKFSQLDKEIAFKLIKRGFKNKVVRYFERFTDIKESDHKEIAYMIIEIAPASVIENFNKFTGIKESDHKEIVEMIIEKDPASVIKNFNKFTGIKESDHKEIIKILIKADKILNIGRGSAIANNLEKFTDIKESDHKEIAYIIIEIDSASVIKNFNKFTGIKESDHKMVVDLVCKYAANDVISNFEKFTGIKKSDHKGIAEMMIENGDSFEVVENLEIFTGIKESDHKGIVDKVINKGGGFSVADNLEKFTGIKESDHKGIADKIIEKGDGHYVADDFDKFTGIKESDHQGITEMMIENGGSLEVINNLEKFTGIKESDHQGITEMMIENGGSLEVVENFEKFTGIKNYYVIIDKLLEYISSTDFLNYLYKFSQKNLDFKKLVGLFVKHGQDKYIFDLYLKLANKSQWAELFDNEQFEEFLSALPQSKNRDERRNAFTHNKYDRASQFLQNLYKAELFYVGEEIEDNNLELEIATEFVKRFALSKQTELYEYFKALYTYEKGINNEIPQQLIDEGIESLDDLEKKYKNLQKLLYSDKELLAKNLRDFTDFEIKLFSQISGKSNHRWDSGRPSMQNIIDDFIYYSKSDSYKAVPEEYEALDLVNNDIEYKFDTEKLKKEDSYYQILKQEMLEMLDINLENNNNLPELVNSIKDKIKAKKNTLPQKKDIPYIKKQLEKYDNILQNLDQIDVKDEQAYDKILKNLLTIDRKTTEKFDLTSDLRKIIYNKVLSKNEFSEIQIESLINALHDAEIKVETLLEMLSFINNTIKDHILNMKDEDNQYWDKETWQQIIKAKNTNKLVNLLKVFNPYLGELKEDIDTVEVIEQGDHQQNISCYPDRGLVGEMSGYLGDACYTSVYPLLKNYPNVIPYKFINESDEDNKEFLGSVLVFELKSKTGEKVALLRAFDIPEEYKVNINEFIETFINNISSSLEARGMKKILIPGTSGAISNYSMTLSHMKNNYIKKGQSISLSKKFAFNGYDITNNCYVAREL